jgi:hypothetical protein
MVGPFMNWTYYILFLGHVVGNFTLNNWYPMDWIEERITIQPECGQLYDFKVNDQKIIPMHDETRQCVYRGSDQQEEPPKRMPGHVCFKNDIEESDQDDKAYIERLERQPWK